MARRADARAVGGGGAARSVGRSFVFEAPSLAQIAVVRTDSWTGDHFYTRSRRWSKSSREIVHLRVHIDINVDTGEGLSAVAFVATAACVAADAPAPTLLAACDDAALAALWEGEPRALASTLHCVLVGLCAREAKFEASERAAGARVADGLEGFVGYPVRLGAIDGLDATDAATYDFARIVSSGADVEMFPGDGQTMVPTDLW